MVTSNTKPACEVVTGLTIFYPFSHLTTKVETAVSVQRSKVKHVKIAKRTERYSGTLLPLLQESHTEIKRNRKPQSINAFSSRIPQIREGGGENK